MTSCQQEVLKGTVEDVTVIRDCYCPNCEQSHATSTLLPTEIPFFRQVIIVSLSCPDCHFKNSEVTFGGQFQPQGKKLTLHITKTSDLDRQIVKSDSATLFIPRLELEIPPTTQRGTISTLEGVLKRAAANLEGGQAERLQLGDLDNFYRCKTVIEKLKFLADSTEPTDEDDNTARIPFDVVLDDPAGNSFIENPLAPQDDPQLVSIHYDRTPAQDMLLGLQPSQTAKDAGRIDNENPSHKNQVNGESSLAVIDDNAPLQDAATIPTDCPNCQQSAETKLCQIQIPHFKQILLMSMLCDGCGYRSTEVKPAGGVSKEGTRLTLRILSEEDLKREVILSDTAGIEIPEIELELAQGMDQGAYTTVEGLLKRLLHRLTLANPFATGDGANRHHSSNNGEEFSRTPLHAKYQSFLNKLCDISEGRRMPATLVLDDTLSNSFVGPIPAVSALSQKEGDLDSNEEYVEAGLIIEVYERTFEQNEALGLNDIKTEDYTEHNSVNYGTDQMEETRDTTRLHRRGLDHPHATAKAPVDNDATVMGSHS